MFKKLIKALRGAGLINRALDEALLALTDAEAVFNAAAHALVDNKTVDFDLYARDRNINRRVIKTRRMILEHLSINPQQDISAALILTTVVVDIERIGDYAKNLLEAAELFPEPFEGLRYFEQLKSLLPKISDLFALTTGALEIEDEEAALRVYELQTEISGSCEAIFAEMVRDDEPTARQAVVCTLTARYFKRVAAHLKNIASSAIHPFERVGFRLDPNY